MLLMVLEIELRGATSAQCLDCIFRLYLFLETELGEIGVTHPYCDIIQHNFIPTRSVARKTFFTNGFVNL